MKLEVKSAFVVYHYVMKIIKSNFCSYFLQIVFFTSKRKYDEVDRRNCIPNRKYKILLEDESVEDAYEALLEHRCRTCNDSPLFDSFGGLRQHMSRSHTLFPCQLCVDHLKVRVT